MLDTLTLVLIAFGLALTLLTLVVGVGAACISAIAYTIWVERTGGLRAIIGKVPSFLPKPKEDSRVPEGFREHYRMWRDPATGQEMLLPKEDVAAMEKMMSEEDELDLEELDAWASGKAETAGTWHGS